MTDGMKERVTMCKDFLAVVCRRSMVVLDNMLTMDKFAVSFHTPKTKEQSKERLSKGLPGPFKAKIHATSTKQIVLAFFWL